tara:strand:- start:111 stop:263 length:153 start_codon:yes stop_codon:yes gene_type:complete
MLLAAGKKFCGLAPLGKSLMAALLLAPAEHMLYCSMALKAIGASYLKKPS